MGARDLNEEAQRTGKAPDPFAGAVPMPDPAEEETRAKAAKAKAERFATLEACKVGAFLDAGLDRMRARSEDRERPIPLPWANVAAELGGGLWPGLYVLVGNTGSGKSQLALQAAVEAARMGTPVLYVGLELGRLDLVARLVGLVSRRKWSRLYLGRNWQGTPDPAELREVEAKHGPELGELRAMPFHLALAPPHGWAYPELTAAAAQLREMYPETDGEGSRPMLVVLDFLQLVAGAPDAREDLRERIGRAAYAGRAVARDYGAAVLMLSSTARENYFLLSGDAKTTAEAGAKQARKARGAPVVTDPLGTGNPARLVGMGKESGDVEYAADAALVLAQEPRGDAALTTCWLAVAKVRARPEGAKGWAELRFDGGRFTEPEARGSGGTVRV